MRIHIGHHFFGAGNLGDDLMMAGFLDAWKRWGSPGTLSCACPFDRTAQQRRFPEVAWLPYDVAARTWAIRHCSVWLGLGGPAFETDSGSWMVEHLAVELEICRRYRKPMFFLCVGVSNRAALEDPCIREVLDYAQRIWTRDSMVARMLGEVQPAEKIVAGADLAQLCLAGLPASRLEGNRLGWILHFDNLRLLDVRAVEQAVERLAPRKQDWLVQEIRPLTGSELATFQAFSPRARAKLTLQTPPYGDADIAEMLQAWPAGETVVSCRFHGACVAAWRGSRVVVVERNDKLRGLAETLGCTRLASARDADALVQAVGRAQPVGRELLEEQAHLAWRSCVGFLRALPRFANRTLTPSMQGIERKEPHETSV